MAGLGTPLWVQFPNGTTDPAEISAMVETYRTYNLAHHDAMVRPYEGVAAQVRALKTAGKRLGLVTSKLRSGALRGLKVAAIEDQFDAVVGSDDVPHPKPHPKPLPKPPQLPPPPAPAS